MGPYVFWLGERDWLARFAGSPPTCRYAAALVEQGFSSTSPRDKKIGALMGPYVFWLGERDSNPRWRSQSPQSYH